MARLYLADGQQFSDEFPIDLGNSSVTGRVRAFWATDRNGERAAIVIAHRDTTGEICASSVYIKSFTGRRVWDVVSMEPLTLSQEIECDCGLTGFISFGQWHDR